MADDAAASVRRRLAGTLLTVTAAWLGATALGGDALALLMGVDPPLVAIVSAVLLVTTIVGALLVPEPPRPRTRAHRRPDARVR